MIVRPLALDELEAVFIGRTALAEQGNLAATPDRDRLRARLPNWGTLRDRHVNLGIEVNGRLIGEIQCFRPKEPQARSDPAAFEVGVSIYEASDRGRGYGTEALRLFVEWLITKGAHRVLGGTAPTNQAMHRVFERAGFIRDNADDDESADLTYGLPLPED